MSNEKIYQENINSDPQKALKAAIASYNQSVRLKEHQNIAKYSSYIATSYFWLGKDSLSEVYVDQAIRYTKSNDDLFLGILYNLKGSIYLQRADYQNSMKYYQAGLKAVENNPKGELTYSSVLNNISNIYLLQNDSLSAIKNFYKTIDFEKKVK